MIKDAKSARRKSKKGKNLEPKVLKTVIEIESLGDFIDYQKFFADVITYYRAVEVTELLIARAGTGKKTLN